MGVCNDVAIHVKPYSNILYHTADKKDTPWWYTVCLSSQGLALDEEILSRHPLGLNFGLTGWNVKKYVNDLGT